MKSTIKILFKSVLLLNATIFLAQTSSGCRAQEIEGDVINRGEYNSLDNQFPTSNLLSSISYLDVTPQLMMNPSSIEEGTKAVGEALGVFGKGEIITAKATGTGRGEIVNAIPSNSSHQVLRLRGGGPKPKNQPTGRLKSAGDSSEEEDAATSPDLESEETSPMNGQVNKYLKDEIINNIYTECLAEVAKLTIGGSVTAGNVSKEAAEWAAAEKAARHSKGQAERALENARIETEEARRLADEAKQNAKNAARVPLQGSSAEQALITATMSYEKARAAYTSSDYEANRRFGILAAARVETADNVLHAISVRNTKQQTIAEAELDDAKETEMQALEAVEAAKADVAVKADLLSSAEASLNDAKKIVKGMSPTSPMTAAQRVAMKGIEKYKTAAETAEASAIDAELRASVAKGKIREMNFERELKAYHDAEEAWMEAGEGYKTALAKVHEVGLDDEELTAALASAEVHEATWRAHARWAKARQADQIVASPGAFLDHLINAETAWANVVDGYKIAIDKSTQAKLKCGELTTSLNNAVSAQTQIQAKMKAPAIAFAKTKATQATEQAALAKEASKTAEEKKNSSESYAWDRVVWTSEQASECWDKVSKAFTQGNQERASLWRKAAEKGNTLAEERKKIALAYAAEDKEKAKRLEKVSEIACHLSDADRWLAESEEALEKGHQDIAEFWRQATVEAQEAAKHWSQAVQAYALGNTEEGEHWENIANAFGYYYHGTEEGTARSLSRVAEYLTKAVEASDKGNSELVTLWTKAAEQMKIVSEYKRKVVQARKLKNKDDDKHWDNTAGFFWSNAIRLMFAAEDFEKALAKATEATAKGNQSLVELWSKIVAQFQKLLEYYPKATEAKLKGNDAEADRLQAIADVAKEIAGSLEKEAKPLEKAAEAKARGNQLLAELWNKLAIQYQESTEFYQKFLEMGIKEFLNGNEINEDSREKRNGFFQESIKVLESASKDLEKATEATAKGNQSLIELWSKIATQYQKSAENYRKAAEAMFIGNDAEADRLGKIARCAEGIAYLLEQAAEPLEKAAEATARGNKFLAELWNKSAIQYQKLTQNCQKFAEISLNGNDIEKDILEKLQYSPDRSGDCLKSASNALEKATEATVKGNHRLVELWSKAAVQYQESADHYRKAVEIQLTGNDAEADRWEKIADFARDSADRLKSAIEPLEKATEATAKGNQPLAELWSKAATQYQEVAEYYQKSAEAKLRGNDAEADRWSLVASHATGSAEKLKSAANNSEKAAEATLKGNRRLANLWSKSSAQYQESAGYYQKVAEAELSGNDAEANRWWNICYPTYESADALQAEAEELAKK